MNRGCFRALLIFILVLTTGCASHQGSDNSQTEQHPSSHIPDPMFGLGDRESFTLSSEVIGRDFQILVRLPRSYESSDRDYPLIVLLDGGILFPMLAPYQLMMEAEGTADEALIVGISYGGLGFSNGNLRATDYTAPSPQVSYFGGAMAYQDFLSEELLPRLTREYRINSSQRVLLGQSLGGQFAMHAALTRPTLFSTYVAVNPAIHANADYFSTLEAVGSKKKRTLIMAIGSEDPIEYRDPAMQWFNHRSGTSSPGLNLELIELADAHHATSAPAAYHTIVRSLFPPQEESAP
ncbi:MAG: alpha/beta hydrolase-fold protein [Wenzhouxiangella sp.]|jgi:predicted alpha/beta superfamily hydrolase|nr:alpha/beta hydrolase-fold protein [Wenzhouxiangella sp.]